MFSTPIKYIYKTYFFILNKMYDFKTNNKKKKKITENFDVVTYNYQILNLIKVLN